MDEASSDENVEAFKKAWLSQLVAGAQDRLPEYAQELLRLIVSSLRNEDRLPRVMSDFLIGALEKAIGDPKHAGAALGLVPNRKRPSEWQRNFALVQSVELLRREGVQLADSRRNGDGAYTRVAQEFATTTRIVENAWLTRPRLQRKLSPPV